MQVPVGWLKEFVPHTFTRDKLKEVLTSIGLESEEFKREPLDFSLVVVGEIIRREKAPSGRGYVYSVDVGNAFPGGIVKVFSTIPDMKVGVKYPVALPGGHVGDLAITERSYEGFVSQGKFCASTELGLTKLQFVERADGTVEWEDGLADVDGRALSIFPDLSDFEVGTDLAEWLLDDPAVTIDLTSNRADCYCLLGVAREVRVVIGAEIKLPPVFDRFREVDGESAEGIRVVIDDPKGCMLYAGLVIDNVRVAPSPLWLAKKLFSVGLRPISNLVDITNLVLYELGQPLHAFDYELLSDATIIVRRAREGERITTIDGVERQLTPSDLVIADSEKPVAIAGVMGGFESEVRGSTRKVLLESAWFDPLSVRRTSRRLGLRTDAAIRFERGVDPKGIVRAVHRVAHLVRELRCGEPAEEIAIARAREEEEIVIPLTEEQVNALLGVEIPTGEIEAILEGLGFTLSGAAPCWNVVVPSFRRDIFIAEDLIEEIARHVGYDNLPEEYPRTHMRTGLVDEDIRMRREVKDILVRLGLWELNSFPFGNRVSMSRFNPLLPDAKPAVVTNPISDDASTLRMNLVPCVIDTFIRNLRRGSTIRDVFEIGKVYWHDGEDFREEYQIVIGVLGERGGKKKERAREHGFLKLKGYVEGFLEALDVRDWDLLPISGADDGASRYVIKRREETLGAVETIPEEVLGDETFERPIFTASFRWGVIKEAYINSRINKTFKPLPSFPAVERDLAFVLDESTAYRIMVEAIREAGGEWLESVKLFDLYRGKQVGENKKNVAVSLRFRHPQRTLTDEEVDERMKAIIERVAERTGGKLRDW